MSSASTNTPSQGSSSGWLGRLIALALFALLAMQLKDMWTRLPPLETVTQQAIAASSEPGVYKGASDTALDGGALGQLRQRNRSQSF